MLTHSVEYIQTRSSGKVEFEVVKPPVDIFAPVNVPLFDWVIENILKNALDAMGGAIVRNSEQRIVQTQLRCVHRIGCQARECDQLHPQIAATRKLRQQIYLAEIFADRLYARALREIPPGETRT